MSKKKSYFQVEGSWSFQSFPLKLFRNSSHHLLRMTNSMMNLIIEISRENCQGIPKDSDKFFIELNLAVIT